MSSSERYAGPRIALHWLMLVLIAAVYALMEFRGMAPRGSAIREWMKSLHYSLGLGVFVLVWLRLVLRLIYPAPPISPLPPPWQRVLAHLFHLALYGLMIAMPLIGWSLLNAEGHAVSLFGLPLPNLLPASDARAEQLEDLHETIATIGYVLIGVHAAAALWHHYALRDNTLRRMLRG